MSQKEYENGVNEISPTKSVGWSEYSPQLPTSSYHGNILIKHVSPKIYFFKFFYLYRNLHRRYLYKIRIGNVRGTYADSYLISYINSYSKNNFFLRTQLQSKIFGVEIDTENSKN